MDNSLINDFVVESSTLHASEYVSKSEMEDFATKNNFELLYLDDRVRQKESSASCSWHNDSDTIYHTFVPVDSSGCFFQYVGQIWGRKSKVKLLDNIIGAFLMVETKRLIKEKSKFYIIRFLKDVNPDCSEMTFISCLTDGFDEKNVKIPGAVDYYCNCERYCSNADELQIIDKMIAKKESEIDEFISNPDSSTEKTIGLLRLNIIHDFLKNYKRRLKDLDVNSFSYKFTKKTS